MYKDVYENFFQTFLKYKCTQIDVNKTIYFKNVCSEKSHVVVTVSNLTDERSLLETVVRLPLVPAVLKPVSTRLHLEASHTWKSRRTVSERRYVAPGQRHSTQVSHHTSTKSLHGSKVMRQNHDTWHFVLV